MFSILIQIFLQCAGKMLTNDLLLDLWDDYFSEFSGTTLHTRNGPFFFTTSLCSLVLNIILNKGFSVLDKSFENWGRSGGISLNILQSLLGHIQSHDAFRPIVHRQKYSMDCYVCYLCNIWLSS